MGTRGCVAAGHPKTAEAAEIILREGGNAYDAVIAAMFAACVAEPVLASLGGGGFLLAQTGRGDTGVFDFFVQTPRSRPQDAVDFYPILADFGTAQQEFHIGLGSIAVPGVVRGAFAIHRELGSMPMRKIVEPAVALAREGVTLNALQAYIFSIVTPIYQATDEAQALFGSKQGDGLLEEGEVFRSAAMADALEVLALEGEDLFYRGEIAQSIVRLCETGGGLLTREDLAGYRAIQRRALETRYRDAQLHLNAPPSSGGVLLAFALQLMDSLTPAEAFGSTKHLRQLIEVMALTRRARIEAHLDPNDASALLDPALLARYRDELHGRPRANRGTTHMSVVDGQHNVATLTLSNGEGCGTLIPDTGIMLNNMLGEEDLNPQGFHRWQTNTRMTSMMTPMVLRLADDRRIALGSGGSNRIRSALLQTTVNLVDFGMYLEDAVSAPRVHLEGDHLSIEGGFRHEAIEPLLDDYPAHHLWDDMNLFFGGVHAVVDDQGSLRGMGDPRRGGVSIEI